MNDNRRRIRRTDLIAYILGFAMIGFAIYLLVHENGKIDNQRVTLDTQTQKIADLEEKIGTSHRQLVDGCNRQTARDIENNISNRADWTVDKFFLLATEHPIQPPASARERNLTAQFIAPIRAAVASKSWVPLTDCEAAVAISGSRYRLPHPVPFNVRKPPRSAITLNPTLFQ